MLAEYFTSYESASACLAFVLILLIPLVVAMAYERWLKPTVARKAVERFVIAELQATHVVDSTQRFYIGQIVRTTHELNYSHGCGLMVPAGHEIELVSCHCTNHGFRWSGLWKTKERPLGVYVYPIPEDMIAPVHS